MSFVVEEDRRASESRQRYITKEVMQGSAKRSHLRLGKG